MKNQSGKQVILNSDLLNPKEKLFLSYYIEDFNGVRSYQKAYNVKDYNLAGVKAHMLLKKDKVKKVLKDVLEPRLLDTDEILKRLSLMGVGDLPTKVVKHSNGNVTEYYDSESALELIGKYYALFVDKHEIDIYELDIIDDDK